MAAGLRSWPHEKVATIRKPFTTYSEIPHPGCSVRLRSISVVASQSWPSILRDSERQGGGDPWGATISTQHWTLAVGGWPVLFLATS